MGRGEFDRQQEGWKMTAGWGGVRFPPEGVEDDRWVGMDDVGRQQGLRMTAGGGGVNLTASRGWERAVSVY